MYVRSHFQGGCSLPGIRNVSRGPSHHHRPQGRVAGARALCITFKVPPSPVTYCCQLGLISNSFQGLLKQFHCLRRKLSKCRPPETFQISAVTSFIFKVQTLYFVFLFENLGVFLSKLSTSTGLNPASAAEQPRDHKSFHKPCSFSDEDLQMKGLA